MEDLFEKLEQYSRTDMYPFHMPGHKRNAFTEEKTYSIDITEIDGFDNLHHPEGIIQELNEFATAMYGTVESRLLVNGSTGGLLTAISACCSYGGKILVARNCHKAVYNGISLRGLGAIYVYPQAEPVFGLNGSISPEAIKEALEANEDVQAVLITSPTYDGVVSDIEAISRIVHAHGLPLIVDEAHGAHLPFSRGLFPESSLKKGGDIVIQSLHKTLPAFTQTALLHVNSQRVDREKVHKYLAVFQSSSPSYILMSGVGSCLKWLREEAWEAFGVYEERLLFWRNKYRELLADTSEIKLVEAGKTEGKALAGVYDYDVSKLVFSTGNGCLSGEELYQIFREKYHLQMEMAAGSYVLALSSVCDREEGFMRLYEALAELIQDLGKKPGKRADATERKISAGREIIPELFEAKTIFSLSEAEGKEKRIVNLKDSAGLVSASSLYLYPPGIPFLLPGEEITKEIIGYVRKVQETGLKVQGLEKNNRIFVLEEFGKF